MTSRFVLQRALSAAVLAVVVSAAMVGGSTAATLDDVKARGKLVCGVNEGLFGFATNEVGIWRGFDVDFCRAVAAAIFNDPKKVDFLPMSTADRFKALQDGKIDILSRNTTWTMQREVEYGLTFVGVTYYDGQGFMLPRSANVLSALELAGSKICVQSGTTTESNLADFFAVNNMEYEAVLTTSSADSVTKYRSGVCNVITSDMSQLYATRVALPDAPEHLILADAISKEPLGPAVREGDPQWATLVKWVLFALLNAEELGVTSFNTDDAVLSKKPDVRRLVGVEGSFGTELGLTNDWVVRLVDAVGNYGQIYDRNLGRGSPLAIPRGMNQLWNLGGIQYAPPVR